MVTKKKYKTDDSRYFAIISLLLVGGMLFAVMEAPTLTYIHQQYPVTVEKIRTINNIVEIQFTNGVRQSFYASEVWAEVGDNFCAVREYPKYTKFDLESFDFEYFEQDCEPMFYEVQR